MTLAVAVAAWSAMAVAQPKPLPAPAAAPRPGAVPARSPQGEIPYPEREEDPDDEDAFERITRRRSPTMMATGVALVATGATSLAAGFLLFVLRGCDDMDPPHCYGVLPDVVTGSMMVNGGITFIVGLPLLYSGKRRVPLYARVPELLVSPRRVGFRWTF